MLNYFRGKRLWTEELVFKLILSLEIGSWGEAGSQGQEALAAHEEEEPRGVAVCRLPQSPLFR